MGAAEVVDEAQPLPTSNEVEEQVPATDTTDAEPVDVQSQAPAPLEGEVLQASNNESQAPVDLPPKVLKRLKRWSIGRVNRKAGKLRVIM